ncbi:MAG: shikimate dehydrogenase [Egibacteraceae bacterium]
MSQPTTARTDLVALLGHPVGHSVSPQIHSAAFAAAGIDAVYVALDVEPDALATAVGGLRAVGFRGANITVPHKQAVGELADERTPEADAVGAVNTLYWSGGRLTADNTDATGLQAFLEHDLGLAEGTPTLLLGSGGAARAAAVALGRVGAHVEVVARREHAGLEVSALARRMGAARVGPVPEPALVVNATPLGLRGEVLPDRFMRLGRGQTALDLVYGPADTPFLTAARAGGAEAHDGLGMLVAQAARSFERWTGTTAPLPAMRRAADIALGR